LNKNQTFVIAEAGVNHNGDINLATQLIDVAADARADAVKFQTFRSEQVISRHAPKAEYQTRTTGADESQLDMVRKLELSEAQHEVLIDHAKSRAIAFLSTPFDEPSLHLLTKRFGLQTIKIPSGEITNAPFLLAIARASSRVIVSTGMSTLADVEAAPLALFRRLQLSLRAGTSSERSFRMRGNKPCASERLCCIAQPNILLHSPKLIWVLWIRWLRRTGCRSVIRIIHQVFIWQLLRSLGAPS